MDESSSITCPTGGPGAPASATPHAGFLRCSIELCQFWLFLHSSLWGSKRETWGTFFVRSHFPPSRADIPWHYLPSYCHLAATSFWFSLPQPSPHLPAEMMSDDSSVYTCCASQLCTLLFLRPGRCRNRVGMLMFLNTLCMRNNFNFSYRSQSQLKSLRFLLMTYSFYFYSFFLFFGAHWRIYATLCESLLLFPKAKHAPVKFMLAEFAGICIVLTKFFCSLLSGFQKPVLIQGWLTNLLYNKAYNDHGKG